MLMKGRAEVPSKSQGTNINTCNNWVFGASLAFPNNRAQEIQSTGKDVSGIKPFYFQHCFWLAKIDIIEDPDKGDD